MSRITVVIEDHAEGIHLGQQLAGGRVVAAAAGDHSELLEAAERTVFHFDAWAADVFGAGLEGRPRWVEHLLAASAKARAT